MNLKIKRLLPDEMNDLLLFLADEQTELFLEINPKLKKNISMRHIVKEMFDDEYSSLDKEAMRLYGGYIDDKIVGAGYVDDNNHLHSLFVNEEYRNNGIGTNILAHIISDCIDRKVLTVNARLEAINLYKRFNFKIIKGIKYDAFVPMELERECYER